MRTAASNDGLTAQEAAERLRRDGPNELPRSGRRSLPRIVRDVLSEPMLALLAVGAIAYLLLGDAVEAVMLATFASLSIVITIVQESRTERVLEALRDLTSPRALVIRNGERVRVAGREVVHGDIVVLAEGDRAPADAVLVEASDLQVDESLLTGESVPVRKRPASANESFAGRPGGDDLPMVFSGTLVVRGSGLAQVTATGVRSEIGRIGASLGGLETEAPRLAVQTGRVVRVFAVVSSAVCVFVVIVYGLARGSWLDGVLAGIALGMALLPEEFPVVLAVFMAMGAWRISRARVLTRRAAAIEALGSATVLCTDKTGTLTENRMSIAEIRLADGSAHAPESQDPAVGAVIEAGALASAPHPTDPMEIAFHALRREGAPSAELVRSYPLRPDLLAMTQVWRTPRATGCIAAAKGAPEAVARLCCIGNSEMKLLTDVVEAMASGGRRVLGVAMATWEAGDLPDAQTAFRFTLLGLVGLEDPLRPAVPAAVAECRAAGIRVVMITGDYPSTARAIARQAGLADGILLTGEELATLDGEALQERVRTATVFARIMPEQKLRIVQVLKANGEVVAMTGDGVNDAPSLKAAHIGIAMGGRGTDVAREAAALVLLDDDFGAIATAVRLGRRIYDNLRKAMGFIFAVHVPIAGLTLAPLLLGWPPLFGPVHIAVLEMVIDPICSLVFEAEPEENDVMRRPPRNPDAPLFTPGLIVGGLLQGVLALAATAGVVWLSSARGMGADEVRAAAFVALVLSILALVFANRSFSASLLGALRRPSWALLAVLVAVAVALSCLLMWPPLRSLFRFAPLHADDLAAAALAAIALLTTLEGLKRLVSTRVIGSPGWARPRQGAT
ncbi:cation-translocating P-type ATPase [Alsobacter sp. SYSU BS001988]